MKKNRKEISMRAHLSSSVKLLDLFIIDIAPEKPSNFTQKSWDIIKEATEFVHKKEIAYLDQLITSYVSAIVKAEGCGCQQCIKSAKILTINLNDEFIRQSATFETNNLYSEDQDLVNKDIKYAIQRLWEIKIDEQDDRWGKLRDLLYKARSDNPHLKLNAQDKKIKIQLQKQIQDIRQKRHSDKNK